MRHRLRLAVAFGVLVPYAVSKAQIPSVEPDLPVLPKIAPISDETPADMEAAFQERVDRLAALDIEIRAADALAKGLLAALTNAKDTASRAALLSEFTLASARLRTALARFNAEVDALADLAPKEILE